MGNQMTEMLLSGVSLKSVTGSCEIKVCENRTELGTEIKSLTEGRLLSKEDFEPIESVEVYRDEEHGFVIKREKNRINPDLEMESAYNLEGKFIGTPEFAKKICVDWGIRPTTYDDNTVCSIGYCPEKKAWYGWSHRAFSPPFQIGYKIEDSNNICCGCFGANDKSLEVGFEAKTEEDCKRLAIAYAFSVD